MKNLDRVFKQLRESGGVLSNSTLKYLNWRYDPKKWLDQMMDQLEEDGVVKITVAGNGRVYTLTEKGRRIASNIKTCTNCGSPIT